MIFFEGSLKSTEKRKTVRIYVISLLSDIQDVFSKKSTINGKKLHSIF